MKIGMYTEKEIFEFMTEEGDFLGRSMYDAIFDKMHALITENEQLKKNNNPLKGIFAGVNDDMLLRDCGNLSAENQQLKDNWNKLKEWLEEEITNDKCCTDLITHCLSIQDLIDEKQYILDKMQEIENGKCVCCPNEDVEEF